MPRAVSAYRRDKVRRLPGENRQLSASRDLDRIRYETESYVTVFNVTLVARLGNRRLFKPFFCYD